MQQAVQSVSTPSRMSAAPRERKTRFFVVLSLVLASIVLVGFSPTFYLRGLFDLRGLPAPVVAHGVSLSAWFVWLVLQTTLAARGRMHLHRKLGVAGALLGIPIVVSGIMVVINVPARLRAAGIAPEVLREIGPPILLQQFASLLSFSVFLALAVVARRRPDAHKRLMVFASLVLVGPAIARIGRWPLFGGEGILIPAPGSLLIPAVLLGLVLSVVLFDIATRRRIHWATAAGSLGVIATTNAAGALVAHSALGSVLARLL